MSGGRIVLDVWGGESSMDHIARYLPPIDECWELARKELEQGYLINLRLEIAWGDMTPFDDRIDMSAGTGALQ